MIFSNLLLKRVSMFKSKNLVEFVRNLTIANKVLGAYGRQL